MRFEIDLWVAIIFAVLAISFIVYANYQRRRSIRDFLFYRNSVSELINRQNRVPRFKVGDRVRQVFPVNNLCRGRNGRVEKIDEKDLTCLVLLDGLSYPIWIEEFRLEKIK